MAKNIYLQVFDEHFDPLQDLFSTPDSSFSAALLRKLTSSGLINETEFNPDDTGNTASETASVLLKLIRNVLERNNNETFNFLEVLSECADETKPDPRVKAKQIVQHMYKQIAILGNTLRQQSVQDLEGN